MNNKIWDATSQSIEALYDIALASQQISREFYHGNGKDPELCYLMEWMSAGVRVPRRSGKTFAMKKLITERGLDALVFTPTSRQASVYDGTGIRAVYAGSRPNTLEKLQKELPNLQLVLVDESEFMRKEEHEKIGKFCIPYVNNFIYDGKPFVFFTVSTSNLKSLEHHGQ